jgi:Predicted transcriptional regulators
MAFYNRIKELRIEKKITQEDLAKILSFGRTAISNYESGRSEPSYNTVSKLAEFFDVSIDYLLGKTDIRNAYTKLPTLNEESLKLIDSTKDLSPESKRMLNEYIKLLNMKELIKKSKDETSASKEDLA